MGKKIVVFSDGTGNAANSPDKTNVWRLYQALDLGTDDQIAMFDDGVGTSSFSPARYLGLAFGFGLKRNVLDLYKFVCRNYEKNDQIFAFGFSRGGFTVRVLNGLINKQGLIPFVSEEHLDHHARSAYRFYRAKGFRPNWFQWLWVTLIRGGRDGVLGVWNWLMGWKSYRDIAAEAREQGVGGDGAVKMDFLGVWDTVAAYGLPVDELTLAVDRFMWPISFGDLKLPDNVVRARQALSLDDERRTFFPLVWVDEEGPHAYGQTLDDQRLLQAWFAGVHADVGGGYPDDRLSLVPLGWMIEEAKRFGLAFDNEICRDYQDAADEQGRLYDSRSGTGIFYRYHPRSVALLAPGTVPLVHQSVITRMAAGSDHYAPVSLDVPVNILAAGNLPVPFAHSKPGAAPGNEYLQRAIDLLIDGSLKEERDVHFDRALAVVWWRRLIYVVMIGLLVAFALLPAFFDDESLRDDQSQALGDLLVPVLNVLRAFLPSFAGLWLDTVHLHPFAALGLLGPFAGLVFLSDVLRKRIHDHAASAWHAHLRASGDALNAARARAQMRAYPIAAVAAIGGAYGVLRYSSTPAGFSWALWPTVLVIGLVALGVGFAVVAAVQLRRSQGKHQTRWLLLEFALWCRRNLARPYAILIRWGTPLLALVVALGLLYQVAARFVFDMRSASGTICASADSIPGPRSGPSHVGDFPTSSPCWSTGFSVEAGMRYRIEIDVPAGSDWFDKTGHADPGGTYGDFWPHTVLKFTKRWWGEKWFTPIARIGRYGLEEYALHPETPLPPPIRFDGDRRAFHDACIMAADKNAGFLSAPITVETAGWASRFRRDQRTAGVVLGEINAAAGRTRPPAICADLARRLGEDVSIPAAKPARRNHLVSVLTARKSGELFLYVNDAVPLVPWLNLYANNFGTAKVTVTPCVSGSTLSGSGTREGGSGCCCWAK